MCASRTGGTALLSIMYEVTPRAIGTEPDSMKGSAQFCLVLWVSSERTQLPSTMSKLALVAILAEPIFFKRPAQFSLVAR